MPQIIEVSTSQLLRVLLELEPRVYFCGRVTPLTRQYAHTKSQNNFLRTGVQTRLRPSLQPPRAKSGGARRRTSKRGCVPAWLGHVSLRRFSREPTISCAQRVTHKSGKSGKFTILEIWAAEPRSLLVAEMTTLWEGPQLQQQLNAARTAGVTWTSSTQEEISDAFIKYSTGGGVQTVGAFELALTALRLYCRGTRRQGGQLSLFYKTAEGCILFDRGCHDG